MTPDDLHALVDIATSLPSTEVERIADATCSGSDALRSLRRRSAGLLREACTVVLSTLSRADHAEVGGVLRGACHANNGRGAADIVWTGPDVPGSVSRLTSSAVADLVDEARNEILLISYAMHTEPGLAAALERAADRRVYIQLLFERSMDNPGFVPTAIPFPGLAAHRLCWPAQNRPPGASMHAKALVIDRKTALVGSANITSTAMLRNIELGILLRDESAAGNIVESIEDLLAQGILRTC